MVSNHSMYGSINLVFEGKEDNSNIWLPYYVLNDLVCSWQNLVCLAKLITEPIIKRLIKGSEWSNVTWLLKAEPDFEFKFDLLPDKFSPLCKDR